MPILTTSTSAAEICQRNRLRKSLIFRNEDTTIDVFLKVERAITPTVSSTIHDYRLPAGGSLGLNWDVDGKEMIQDRWTVVAASGNPVVSFFETEDVVR